MDDTWQAKCGPTMQPPAVLTTSQQEFLNQLEIGSAAHYPYDLRPSAKLGRMHDAMSSPSLSNSGARVSDIGSSFLALLSRPPALSQHDLDSFSGSKSFAVSNKVALDGGCVPSSSIWSHALKSVATTSTSLPPDYPARCDSGNRGGFRPSLPQCFATSSTPAWNGPPNGSSSVQDLDLPNAFVNYILPRGSKGKNTCLQQAEEVPRISSPKEMKHHNEHVHVPWAMPFAFECSASISPSNLTSSHRHVFCLGTGGDLLVSNNGLLVIRCLCHFIDMSVSQFSKHSGLRNGSPGNAVHVDTGETIAQWRKLYFCNNGQQDLWMLRVPEDQSGWDWPDGSSLTAGLAKCGQSMLSSRPQSCDYNILVGVQPSGNVNLQNNSRDTALDCKHQRNGLGSNDFFLHGFGSKPQDNFHACPVRSSGVSIENGATSGGIISKGQSSSNIELRLGQPCQQSWGSGELDLLGKESIGPSLELFPSEQNIFNATCCRVEKQTKGQYPRTSSLPNSSAWRSDLLNHEYFASGNCLGMDPKGSTSKHLHIPSSESLCSGIADKACHIRELNVSQTPKSNVHVVQFDPIHKTHTGGYYREYHSHVPILCLNRAPDDVPPMGWISDNFNLNQGPRCRKYNPKENPNAVSGVLSGFISPGVSETCDKDLYLSHFPSAPVHGSDGRSFPMQKVNSCNSGDQRGHVFLRSPVRFGHIPQPKEVSIDFLSYASPPTPVLTPMLHNHNGIGGGLDDNLRLLALKEVMLTSKQPNVICPTRQNIKQGKFDKSATALSQRSLVQPSSFGELKPVGILSDKQDMFKVVAQQTYTGHPADLHVEKIAPAAGYENCSVFSRFKHKEPLICKDFDKGCQPSLLNEQHSSSLGQPPRSTCKVNQIDNCHHCNCTGVKCDARDGCSTITLGQSQKSIAVSKVSRDCPFSEEPTAPPLKQYTESDERQSDKISWCNYQWKDVPRKVTKAFEWTSTIESNDPLNGKGQESYQLGAHTARTSDQHVEDSSKEEEWSNVSSGCSYPAVTRLSRGVNKMYSSTVVAGNSEFVDHLAADAESQIDKHCSSDGTLESNRSPGFHSSTLKTNIKEMPNVADQSRRSLLDEVKLMDALTWKKCGNKVQRGASFPEKDNTFHDSIRGRNHGKRKGDMKIEDAKRKKTVAPFSNSLSRKRDLQSLYGARDDNEQHSHSCLSFKDLGGKKLINSDISDAFTVSLTEESIQAVEGKTTKFTICQKPVACGKYGILCSGSSVSKQVKIVSLDKVIKASKKCMTRKEVYVRERSIYELTSLGTNSSLEKGSHKEVIQPFQISQRKISENFPPSWGVGFKRCIQEQRDISVKDADPFCSVCKSSNSDELNHLVECEQCLIKVHQACYGVTKVPKAHWYCRPCRAGARNIVCVLCGYGGGAMTQALRSRMIVKSLLKAWEIDNLLKPGVVETSTSGVCTAVSKNWLHISEYSRRHRDELKVENSIIEGVLDSTVKQWIHMVCGLWTSDTLCPNVSTMSAFDVSGVSLARTIVVCSLCNRPGGSCINCRVVNCSAQFHPWCAHQKGLLQNEVEGIHGENVGFYGRCAIHAAYRIGEPASDANILTANHGGKEPSCARTEGYKGRKQDGFWHNVNSQPKGKMRSFIPPEQLNAWIYINGSRSYARGLSRSPRSEMEHDCRKEYGRYKQAKGWKRLVVYKSGIHALGLYTFQFIHRGEMVVEYVGEIVGPHVSDKREKEYQSGKRVQYKSACYFFRIDKELVIDATRKGGIARFVNHSCQPNCMAKVLSIRTEKKVVFFAARDIYPGEEITYDYNFNSEDEGMKIPCYCNSKNCRLFLN